MPFRPLTLAQCVHVLDHALRFRSPRHFDEGLARPLLFRQLNGCEEARQLRQDMKEWPTLLVRRALYKLVKKSLSGLGLSEHSPAERALGLLIETLVHSRINPQYLENYWLNSALGYSDVMMRHPGGVTRIQQLNDVLASEGTLWPPSQWNRFPHWEEGTPESHELLAYQLYIAGEPPWGRLCALLLSPEHAPLREHALAQYGEIGRVLELANYALSIPAPAFELASSQEVKQYLNTCEALYLKAIEATCYSPKQTLILVEGLSEEHLLPAILGYENPSAMQHFRVQACGGKTAMAKHYSEARRWFNGTIKLVLDADAHDVEPALLSRLTPSDSLYRIPTGSLEDCYPVPLFLEAVNHFREGYKPLSLVDYEAWCRANNMGGSSRYHLYERFWQSHGLEQLDKTLLAKTVAQLIPHQSPMPKAFTALHAFLYSE